jgi:hypothetical protein
MASNYEPKMTDGNYDDSRLLVIDVSESKQKDDPRWGARLKEEMTAFLGNAQRAYQLLCPNEGKIVVSEELKTRNKDFSAENGLEHEVLVQECFKIDLARGVAESLTGLQVMQVMARKSIPHAPQRMREFGTYLETRYGIQKKRLGSGVHYHGLLFKDEKTAEAYQNTAF